MIQKCDFCADRQAAGQTACLQRGLPDRRADLWHAQSDAGYWLPRRLVASGNYIQHIYGEKEAGGTSMLYISEVDFKNLGFPELSDVALPAITWPYMQAVPGRHRRHGHPEHRHLPAHAPQARTARKEKGGNEMASTHKGKRNSVSTQISVYATTRSARA